jgi:excinuclease UvrABC nuclease subunit
VSFAGEPRVLAVTESLDAHLEETPESAAVFVIWPHEGSPYIARTGLLRRRLKRLLRAPSTPSRLLNLRHVADRVEYWPVASRLESSLVLWEVARRHAPDQYLEIVRLRFPSYVKLVLGNEYPRTQVTTRLAGSTGQYFGPFCSRGSAEAFEHQFLDLFQLRRCQEDLVPAPDHPGCMYGEMSMCLRPCQQVVGREEYATEARRVSEFLSTGGRQLLRTAEAARDRLSAELEYEAAAREHKRIAQIQQILKTRDELVADVEDLHGVAVTPSNEPHVVQLWFVVNGAWQPPVPFSVALADQTVSMDRRVKEIVSGLNPVKGSSRERQEHLAMLARWFYSSWRDGVWVSIPDLGSAPYRKIIGAISRTAHE